MLQVQYVRINTRSSCLIVEEQWNVSFVVFLTSCSRVPEPFLASALWEQCPPFCYLPIGIRQERHKCSILVLPANKTCGKFGHKFGTTPVCRARICSGTETAQTVLCRLSQMSLPCDCTGITLRTKRHGSCEIPSLIWCTGAGAGSFYFLIASVTCSAWPNEIIKTLVNSFLFIGNGKKTTQGTPHLPCSKALLVIALAIRIRVRGENSATPTVSDKSTSCFFFSVNLLPKMVVIPNAEM